MDAVGIAEEKGICEKQSKGHEDQAEITGKTWAPLDGLVIAEL